MARGRMLNQKIAEDIDFNSMSIEAQFMFMRTVPFLDRDGLIVGHPSLLWSKVAPLLPQYAAQMPGIIDEWIVAGFVVSYIADKTPLLYFKGFSKNQVGMRYDREPASIYPPPPGFYRNGNGIEPVEDKPQEPPTNDGDNPPTSGRLPANIRQTSGEHPAECRPNRIEVEKNKTTTARETIRNDSENQNGGSGGGFSETSQTLNRQIDPEYAQVCRAIEDNGFGFMTPMLAEEVGELLKEYPLQWILDAMRIAVDANKRTMRYTAGILRKWRADGRDPTMPGASPPGQPLQPPKPEVYVMPAAARALVDRLKSLSPQ